MRLPLERNTSPYPYQALTTSSLGTSHEIEVGLYRYFLP